MSQLGQQLAPAAEQRTQQPRNREHDMPVRNRLQFVCRENTEEAYTGRSEEILDDAGRVLGRRTPMDVTRAGTERVCRYAFELARRRRAPGRPGKVTCVVKSNIIAAHRFFEDVFRELGAGEYADLEQEVQMFDAFCMWQIRNPEWLDVVVAPDLVGDLVSDNGSTTQGAWAWPPAATSATPTRCSSRSTAPPRSTRARTSSTPWPRCCAPRSCATG
jgi:isocitrate/isopropylmalate dehydrogenase